MLRKRLLILLGGCFLMGSAAWADDVGYVDCSTHPEALQVYAKARQTPEVVASVSCGERFTILVYGFIFSRVQTRDGKIGYIYSNLISVDHSGTPAPQPAAARAPAATSPSVTMAAERTSIPRTPAINAQPAPQTAQSAQPEPAAVPATVSQPQPAPAQSTPVQPAPPPMASAAPAPAPEPTSKAPEAAAATVAPSPAPSPESQPAPVLPTAAQVEAATPVSATQPASNAPEAATAQPSPAAAAQPQPQPESAEPAAPPVRNANVRSTWEKPLPGAHRSFLLELYGGYSLARFVSGATSTNLNGAMGSFGWNMTSWLQIVGDSSYNFVTVGSTKNVLYGNHFGPRFFYHWRNRWGITPFAEALVGGSRLDTTVSGTGGYKTSTNCISYKAGGGVDFRASRHWEVRAFDFDYYRTAFGTNAHQNNYSVSAGVVLRLFATGAAE